MSRSEITWAAWVNQQQDPEQPADKVLIVEDSKSIRGALKPELERVCGVEVLVAATYAEAVDIFKTQGSSLFLAILDLALPDAMHGEIVDYAATHEVPNVVFTSTFDASIREDILSKGSIDYIIKSSRSVEELVHIVRRLQKNRKIRALVVDDSRAARFSLQSSLALYMFQVQTAKNGQEALELLAQGKPVDLILTDHEMPGMDGVDLTAHIRKSFSKEELAIVGVTSTKDETLAAKFLKSGANDFMRKPLGREEFYCRVLNNIEGLEHLRRVKNWTDTIAESASFQRLIMESVDVGILLIDPNLHIVEAANNAAATMFGAPIEQIVGQVCHSFLCPAEYGHCPVTDLGKEVEHSERVMLRADGTRAHVLKSVKRFNMNGTEKLLETFMDISERKQAEAMRDQIERIIQHDLRAPVSSVFYTAQLLGTDDNLTKDQRQLLDALKQSANQMLETLNSSSELYKIETGQYKLKLEIFDCADIVRAMIQTLTRDSRFSGINIELLSGGLPMTPSFHYMCQGQRNFLVTAMQNLLVNALEASPPGATVTVDLLPSNKGCRIDITNNGVVPVAIRNQFFDKYVTSGKHQGTGLGTYSAKIMIKAQGGEIAMHTSDDDNKTMVTILLPS
jgi:PAS domain S-box-containing protein